MGSIKPIGGESVHRIHAGQVVLELQQALKELVENSLDAGASSIEVRIKDHGKDTVEVVDNGSGIAEEDWASIGRSAVNLQALNNVEVLIHDAGLKHHTSKLPDLAALPHVTTFGFRGEALSALCALCESVTIITATKETAPLGAIIKLGKDGKVEDCSGRVARPRGTTITLSGLFIPLPVRRKEFERTAKREYTKALTTLTSYALVPASASKADGREGVRLKVESVAPGKNGKRNALITTDGRGSLRSSVISVWGPKALENVLDVDLELDVDVDRVMAKREGLNGAAPASQAVRISGLISSAAWGQGRSSPDRQFYYMNGRPVDLPVVAKAVNEVYRSFNTHQLPLVILDFSVPRESVDINVSPDKRSIFLHSEAQLVDALKVALDEFFQPSRSSFAVEGASQKVTLVQSSLLSPPRPSTTQAEAMRAQASRSITPVEQESLEEEHSDPESGPEPAVVGVVRNSIGARPARRGGPSQVVQSISTSTASWSPDRASRSSAGRSSRASLRERIKGYASQSAAPAPTSSPEEEESEVEPESEEEEGGAVASSSASGHIDREENEEGGAEASDQNDDEEEIQVVPDDPRTRFTARASGRSASARSALQLSSTGRPSMTNAIEADDTPASDPASVADSPVPSIAVHLPEEPSRAGPSRRRRRSTPVETEEDNIDANAAIMSDSDPAVAGRLSVSPVEPADPPHRAERVGTSYRQEISSTAVNGVMTMSFDLDGLRDRRRKRRRKADPSDVHGVRSTAAYKVLNERGISTAAGIANKDMTSAGEALSRVISKADFADMEVLGQFNKGFIIARLRHPPADSQGNSNSDGKTVAGADDLFIIDQHASDEKYNFETLQRTTVIKAQSLIRPRPLQLTAGDEIVAMENLDILHSNGFEVEIDEDKAPGRGERISLTAMPVSKETTFDTKDLEQLLHLLSDGSRPAGQMVRCTKARAMFAMRACRKSVMIGKSLTKGQMVALLRNMGTIDQPWNCPHGRPTMRHLTKLDRSPKSGGRIDWASWTP